MSRHRSGSSNKIKVIYDISVMAQAYTRVKSRTGVFRVVDNIARGLAASGECQLSFCLSSTNGEPIHFLAQDPELRDVELLLPLPVKLRQKLFRIKSGLTTTIDAEDSKYRLLLLKAIRRSVDQGAAISRLSARVVSNEELMNADVYHSPFNAIPVQVRVAPPIKKFLTVYDLIPIRFPKLCEVETTSVVRRSLDSLRPEDFALCISQSTKDDLCEYRKDCDPQRFIVTHLAASKLFRPCADSACVREVRGKYVESGYPYFLSLSTLEPRKNLEQVIKCFSTLVAEQSLHHLRLVLVGAQGWNYEAIIKTAAHSGMTPEQIIFTGYVPDEDLSALYSGALAFIYLSLYEGFGLPPLEAMQCGVPVITSNTSSLPELIGDAGMMFTPSDKDGICQAMLALYRDQALRKELSARSIERSRLFSWDQTVAKTLAAYKLALHS